MKECPLQGGPRKSGLQPPGGSSAYSSLQGWLGLGKGGEGLAKSLSWRRGTIWGWSWEEPEPGLCSENACWAGDAALTIHALATLMITADSGVHLG